MQVQEAPNRLRELRQGRELELYDISVKLRVSSATISRWERGVSAIPDDAKASLAALFGVTRAYLMGWDEDGSALPDRSVAA
jgi:transcriptional regulator with XRE-family HTH domain